ncbi:hypothetical protein T492DRAFT_357972 [Pavlovales sp. CCMP2436]|nr:hypothetical protein T492DRAFT_357972 [Pavlovales sp. CCMP2436]
MYTAVRELCAFTSAGPAGGRQWALRQGAALPEEAELRRMPTASSADVLDCEGVCRLLASEAGAQVL